MTETDMNQFVRWLQTHTAMSRVAHGELMAALRAAEAHGYTITAPAAESGQ